VAPRRRGGDADGLPTDDPQADALADAWLRRLLRHGLIPKERKALEEAADPARLRRRAEAALGAPGRTVAEARTLLEALRVLGEPDPAAIGLSAEAPSARTAGAILDLADGEARPGSAETLLAWLREKPEAAGSEGREAVRCEAVRLLGKLKNGPDEATRDLLLSLLADRGEPKELRMQAALALSAPRFEGPEAIAAFEKVLLDPGETDSIVQRACLREGLGRAASLDRLRELFRDRRVYGHPYFGIRVDVACGLASLGCDDETSLSILRGYLLDADPADKARLLPQEAWLSLWTLTGLAPGVRDPAPFAKRPRAGAADRSRLFDYQQLRVGVTKAAVEEVRAIVTDPERLRAALAAFEAPR